MMNEMNIFGKEKTTSSPRKYSHESNYNFLASLNAESN